MAKVIKYTKNRLISFLKILSGNIYIYFYDLNETQFDQVIEDIIKFMYEAEVFRISNVKGNNLAISGRLNYDLISLLVTLLDNLDIGEVEITECKDVKKMVGFITGSDSNSLIKKENLKSIYINKDEQTIQLYNIR